MIALTLHVERLRDEELVVARFVEERRKPGLIPSPAVGIDNDSSGEKKRPSSRET
jgi:hypothetical protein